LSSDKNAGSVCHTFVGSNIFRRRKGALRFLCVRLCLAHFFIAHSCYRNTQNQRCFATTTQKHPHEIVRVFAFFIRFKASYMFLKHSFHKPLR